MKNLMFLGLCVALLCVCAAIMLDPSILHAAAHAHAGSAMAVAGLVPARRPGLIGLSRRGIVSVRSEVSIGEVKALIESIQKTHTEFMAANNARLDGIEKGRPDVLSEEKVKRIDDELSKIQQQLAGLSLNGNGNGDRANMTAEQQAHAKAFKNYFRKGAENGLGELQVKASLTEGASPEGGYTVSIDIEKTIDRVLTKVSAMRGLATVISISSAGYKKPVNKGGTATGWTGETGARTQTTAASLVGVDFEPKELYAEPAISQTLLDDANMDIGQWLADEISLVFGEQEGTAFITGDGAAAPFGLLSYATVADASWKWGKLGYVAMGTGGAFKTDGTAFDDIIDLQVSLKQGYRPNASWLMNRKTEGAVRKIKDPEGHYLWQPALQVGAVASLSGYPVAIDDNMQDIGGSNYPIAFGDFRRGYLIVDRVGVRVLRDNLTAKPFVLFYTTKRVGGGVQNFEAIKLGKITP